jgi:hypothetical protein
MLALHGGIAFCVKILLAKSGGYVKNYFGTTLAKVFVNECWCQLKIPRMLKINCPQNDSYGNSLLSHLRGGAPGPCPPLQGWSLNGVITTWRKP